MSIVAACVITAVPPPGPTVLVFAAVTTLLATAGGAFGAASDAQAVVAKKAFGRPVLSGAHATYGIGGVMAGRWARSLPGPAAARGPPVPRPTCRP
ncbi:hypothetical protein [Streptomyces marincola]|uniref:hypothetical protein n=1 Tax=Streptomyces marincola TaxID=2878388 RepID=UPI001CF2BD5D|nr:hypothetical protein [Streptomyces marincola]UCM87954.1 hypothetical protein LC193_08285 [Streptomyces marincola]